MRLWAGVGVRARVRVRVRARPRVRVRARPRVRARLRLRVSSHGPGASRHVSGGGSARSTTSLVTCVRGRGRVSSP